jgi:hypothetical protein
MLKKFFLFFVISFFVCSCAPTYPKENLIEDVKKLVLKETGRKCEVYKFNSTIFLDMKMDDLTSTKSEVINNAVKALQNAVFAITRVSLSSDADIKIMVISAFDPNYQVLLRMFQNMDDVKSYFFQRISRGDYEQRQLIEFEGPDTAKETILDKHYISQEEYVARLIVSQINMSARTNPFLSAAISALGLRYDSFDNGCIYISSKMSKSSPVEKLLDKIISEKLNEYIKKYKIPSIKSVAVLLDNRNVAFEVLADTKI